MKPTTLPQLLSITILVLLWLTTACSAVRPLHPAAAPPPYVVLKLDDAYYENGFIHPGWTQVFDYLNEQNIVATIGIIGERMQEGSPQFYNWLREQNTRGHEIWNHGWCHCKPLVDGRQAREFRGTDYATQLLNLQQTQALAEDKLGLTMTTFGAPYNAVDTNTARALANLAELTNWLYVPDDVSTEKNRYPRVPALNLEVPVHVPNPDSLMAAWDDYKSVPLMVLQGHPRSWVANGDRMKDFKRIIEFLVSKKVQFITPSQYSKLKKQ